jgi:dephospho-CoA kinase
MAHAVIKHIGLTGGIGSGKSTVGGMLTELGAHWVDTDAISRALTMPGGQALSAIEQAFGADAIDESGGMNRPFMRQLVFTDANVRQRLEAILHPLIGQAAHSQAALAMPDQRVVFDVPLLVESLPRWRPLVDRIVVVDCLPSTQIERVMARSGWPRDMVEQVIKQQAQREHRLAVADHVLFNEGKNLSQLNDQVKALWELWNNAP